MQTQVKKTTLWAVLWVLATLPAIANAATLRVNCNANHWTEANPEGHLHSPADWAARAEHDSGLGQLQGKHHHPEHG